MSGTKILAQIHIDAGDGPTNLGDFRFWALPRIGERVMIGEEPTDVWLSVKRVTRVPVHSGEESWDGLVILNCEIET